MIRRRRLGLGVNQFDLDVTNDDGYASEGRRLSRRVDEHEYEGEF